MIDRDVDPVSASVGSDDQPVAIAFDDSQEASVFVRAV